MLPCRSSCNSSDRKTTLSHTQFLVYFSHIPIISLMHTHNCLSLFGAVNWYQMLTSARNIHSIAQRYTFNVSYLPNMIVSCLSFIHPAVLRAPSTFPSPPSLHSYQIHLLHHSISLSASEESSTTTTTSIWTPWGDSSFSCAGQTPHYPTVTSSVTLFTGLF